MFYKYAAATGFGLAWDCFRTVERLEHQSKESRPTVPNESDLDSRKLSRAPCKVAIFRQMQFGVFLSTLFSKKIFEKFQIPVYSS